MDVLVVTADSPLGATLARSLRQRSITVDITRSSELAGRMLSSTAYAAVIVDRDSLPDAASLVVEVRRARSQPTIVLSTEVPRATDVLSGVYWMARPPDIDALVSRISAPSSEPGAASARARHER